MEEGATRTIEQVCRKRTCEKCGESATHKLTFLLPNARTNSASKAYGRDDCTHCSDSDMFVCTEHSKDRDDIARELGMSWAGTLDGTYDNGNRWKHLFLYWETIKDSP